MKKKILFSVLGVGLGHATRVDAILRQLKGKAECKVIASDYSFSYLKQKGHSPIKIDSISFGKKQFAFDLSASIARNLDYPIQMTKNYLKIAGLIDSFKPDLIFSDSEPTSFLVALSKNQRIYSLTNHIVALDESKRVSVPNNMKNQLVVIEKMMGFLIRNSEKVFVPCFYRPKSHIRRIEYTGLILRKERGVVEEDDYYLVTLGGSDFSNDMLDILFKILPKFKDKKFVISTNNLFKNKMKRRNMYLYPFLSENYIRKAKGIITLGGYSTISEAIGYKKPIFMFPIKNHVEQFMNAHLVKRLGFGDYFYSRNRFTSEAIEEKLNAFFDNHEEYKKKLEKADVGTNGAEEIALNLIH